MDSHKTNYRDFLPDLFSKIHPESGSINHRISNCSNYESYIACIWINFNLRNFQYHDPFYGLIEAKSNFEMFFETTYEDKKILIKNIKDLTNKEYRFSGKDLSGLFSNSIEFFIKYCKFGPFLNGFIEFEMKYILTNSVSYGMMTGSFEEHSEYEGYMNVRLNVEDLSFEDCLNLEPKLIPDFIDSKIYNLGEMKEFDNGYAGIGRKYYKIPIR